MPSRQPTKEQTCAEPTHAGEAQGTAGEMPQRPRRLRRSVSLRALVAETVLVPSKLIYPLFVVPGRGQRDPILSLPGQFHLSPDRLAEEAHAAWQAGVRSVLVFGVPEKKDDFGREAANPDGPAHKGVRALKAALPDLVVMADVCLCAYTTHGHCGVVCDSGEILNDETLELLAGAAVSLAEAGADLVAPSDMMDGRVRTIRSALDRSGFARVGIMAYSAKYASSFFGPFRECAGSAPSFGDRRSYQIDPANRREALREARLDVDEGADIIMVKPALAYLDIISDLRAALDRPIAAYNVSGEYAMVKAAAERGWVDEPAVVIETLTSIARAGADLIITYHARDVALWLGESGTALPTWAREAPR